jgi:hypothetical protein
MEILSPEKLRARLELELLKIDGSLNLLPKINESNSEAEPFIEIDRYGYNYVCIERNEEIFRKIPPDLDWLIFEVFRDITWQMASEWELKHRNPNEDFRKQSFAKRVELMKRINPTFGERIEQEINQILLYAPYSN